MGVVSASEGRFPRSSLDRVSGPFATESACAGIPFRALLARRVYLPRLRRALRSAA